MKRKIGHGFDGCDRFLRILVKINPFLSVVSAKSVSYFLRSTDA